VEALGSLGCGKLRINIMPEKESPKLFTDEEEEQRRRENLIQGHLSTIPPVGVKGRGKRIEPEKSLDELAGAPSDDLETVDPHE
jgi:hypothetical protein